MDVLTWCLFNTIPGKQCSVYLPTAKFTKPEIYAYVVVILLITMHDGNA